MYSRVSDRAFFELMNEVFFTEIGDCKMTWREIKDWAASEEYKKVLASFKVQIELWTDR